MTGILRTGRRIAQGRLKRRQLTKEVATAEHAPESLPRGVTWRFRTRRGRDPRGPWLHPGVIGFGRRLIETGAIVRSILGVCVAEVSARSACVSPEASLPPGSTPATSPASGNVRRTGRESSGSGSANDKGCPPPNASRRCETRSVKLREHGDRLLAGRPVRSPAAAALRADRRPRRPARPPTRPALGRVLASSTSGTSARGPLKTRRGRVRSPMARGAASATTRGWVDVLVSGVCRGQQARFRKSRIAWGRESRR